MARILFQYHPVIGYTYIPAIRARVPHRDGGYLIRVNGQGFRCNHEFLEKKSSQFRALLFGDSFTAGDGVSNEERFGDQLERNIPGLEVYNFGLPGTGTDQQYLTYQQCAGGIGYDLLILAIFVENVRRVDSHYRLYTTDEGELVAYAKPYYVLENGRLLLKNVPVPKSPFPISALGAEEQPYIEPDGRLPVLKEFIRKEAAEFLSQRTNRSPQIPEYDDPHNPAWRILKAILTEWIRAAKAPVILLPIPQYFHVEGSADASGYQRRFQEIATETRCILHDPLSDLQRYSPEQRRGFRFRIDFHMSAAGHAALAASLSPVVNKIRDLEVFR